MFINKILLKGICALAILFSFGFASQTLAQSSNEPAFSGPYAGVELSYVTDKNPNTGVGSIGGVAYGVFFGARHQNEKNFVFGIEGGFSKSSLSSTDIVPGPVTLTTELTRLFAFEAIMGYAVKNKVLVYVLAGYAEGKAKTSVNSGPFTSSSDGAIRVGVGVEFLITNTIRARIKATQNGFGGGGGKLSSTTVGAGIVLDF